MAKRKPNTPKTLSQRQLRAGELLRHALVSILQRGELRDPALEGVSITVTEVRPSPDLRQAKVYIAPLGGSGPDEAERVAKAVQKGASFLRGRLGREIDMKFTPELHFYADTTYDAASDIDALLSRPQVARDLQRGDEDEN